MKQLIIATRNQHKFREIQSFLQDQGNRIECVSLLDYPKIPDVDENCLSFVGNALKKAKTISNLTKQPVLADDSGLVVPALSGQPGVFSARYAGQGSTDDQNNQKLLKELKNIPTSERNAYFACALVMYSPSGIFHTSQGQLHGMMIDDPRGKNGFGYDPIFYMPDRKCTLAEVPHEEKIKFSHRTRALEQLLKITDLNF